MKKLASIIVLALQLPIHITAWPDLQGAGLQLGRRKLFQADCGSFQTFKADLASLGLVQDQAAQEIKEGWLRACSGAVIPEDAAADAAQRVAELFSQEVNAAVELGAEQDDCNDQSLLFAANIAEVYSLQLRLAMKAGLDAASDNDSLIAQAAEGSQPTKKIETFLEDPHIAGRPLEAATRVLEVTNAVEGTLKVALLEAFKRVRKKGKCSAQTTIWTCRRVGPADGLDMV